MKEWGLDSSHSFAWKRTENTNIWALYRLIDDVNFIVLSPHIVDVDWNKSKEESLRVDEAKWRRFEKEVHEWTAHFEFQLQTRDNSEGLDILESIV